MSATDDTTQSVLARNSATAREYFAAINDRDLDRAEVCWVKSGGLEAVPGARELSVPAGMRGFFDELFGAFGKWSVEVLNTTAEDDRVVVHWRMNAGFTGPGTFDGFTATNVEGSVQGCDQLTFVDGLIVRNDAYFDGMEMGRAVGLMPPAGSRADKAMTAMVNAQTRVKRLFGR